MSNVIAWIVAHAGLVSALAVAIIDFLIGLSPSLASNSIIELILAGLQKLLPGSSSS